jgi:integrase
VRNDRATGRYVAPASVTLDQYLDGWLPAPCRGVEPGTERTYRDVFRVPRELLGKRKLQSLDIPDVNAVVEYMLAEGRKKGDAPGAPLSPRSVQLTLMMMRRAFKDAVRDRKMAWNPAEHVSAPRQQRKQVHPWTDAQVRTFMAATRADRLYAVWRLALLALRPEEVAGLRWDSVDLQEATLTITRVRVMVAGKMLDRETAKTPAGERTLPLDPGTVAALRELHARQAAERLAAGPAYETTDHGGYVAADEIGHPFNQQRLRNTFRRAVTAASVPLITFHHARHSTLSYLLNSGQVPPSIVAAWAGHADGGETALRHYVRIRPGDLEAARDALAKLLGA